MANGDESDSGGGTRSVQQNAVRVLSGILTAMQNSFPQIVGLSTSATTGPSIALPAHPVGYLTITLPDGTTAKVPYYNG